MVLAREGQHSKKVPPALKAWHDKYEYAAQSLAPDLPVHAPAKIEKVLAVLDGLREYERADVRAPPIFQRFSPCLCSASGAYCGWFANLHLTQGMLC